MKKAESAVSVLLSDVPPRSKVRLMSIEGNAAFQLHLIGMGVRRHAEVDVLKNDFAGPVVLGFMHNRVALGRAVARKIWVQ